MVSNDFKIAQRNEANDEETSSFVASLNSTADPSSGAPFFSQAADVIVTRAPGRLDVMGGIADYSGSLVLQLPIRNATLTALQKNDSTELRILSASAEPRFIEFPLSEFRGTTGEPISYTAARRRFDNKTERWAAYVAGAFLVLLREKRFRFERGANILIQSSVPEGKGVSSSAAVEVAVMQAINIAFELGINPRELGLLCQKVENLVAGAPCGIMDQMTSACGEQDKLLELLCQPDLLKGTVALPKELAVWGIDSGVRHSVGGSDYGTVRTAAFMGYRIIADVARLSVSPTGTAGKVQVTDPNWSGYLANITPEEFESTFAASLPERMRGTDFLDRYQGITDSVTSVNPEAEYPVRSATKHPIYEHARVKSFAATLKSWSGIEAAPRLGSLMFESHQSYSDCGLGTEATDLIVSLVREHLNEALFGARITGGGSGGTVAVLGKAGAADAIENVRQKFSERTGHDPLLIWGSSPGAGVFNHLKLEKLTSTNA